MSGACSSISGAIGRPSPACSDRRRRVTPVPQAPAPRAGPKRRLLVVDDEPYVGLLLRPRLEDRGYRVRLARNLAQARATLDAEGGTPDALLLDLRLPDGSGLDLLRELRSRPATANLPVIVLTAEGDDEVLRDVRALGARLLTKPFSPSKLTGHLAAMLGDAADEEEGK